MSERESIDDLVSIAARNVSDRPCVCAVPCTACLGRGHTIDDDLGAQGCDVCGCDGWLSTRCEAGVWDCPPAPRVVDVPTINREIEYLDEAIARSDRPEGEMELMSDFRSTLWVLVNGHARIDHAGALRDENERLRKLLSEAYLAALAFYAGGEK